MEKRDYKVDGLNKLSKQLNQFQIDMGFTNSDISQRLMLVNSEISEMFEAYRKDKYANVVEFEKKLNELHDKFTNKELLWESIFEKLIKDTFEDEAADIFIRFIAFCGENNIDIEKHVKLKMKYNHTRGHKYGGKKF